jgi:hypothetical protein
MSFGMIVLVIFLAHNNNKEIFLQIFTNLAKKGFVIKSYS